MRSVLGVILVLLFIESFTVQSQTAKDSLVVDTTSVTKLEFVDINQIYTGDAFQYTEKQMVNEQSWWQKFVSWLSHKLSELFKVSNPQKTIHILEWVFKIGGIVLVLFVIYKIVMSLLSEDGRWIFGKKSNSLALEVHDIEQQILSTNFNQLIQEAIQKGQFRLAIRYYYLLTLQKLNQKELIHWQYEKTNRDYYNELKNSELKNKFRYISYLYEYAWYGEFEVSHQEFEIGSHYFDTVLKSL